MLAVRLPRFAPKRPFNFKISRSNCSKPVFHSGTPSNPNDSLTSRMVVRSQEYGIWPEIEQSEDPVYKRGVQMLASGAPALIGISLLNPYYGKKENLQSIFEYFGSRSAQMFIFIPDKPLVHTYRAKGLGNIAPEMRLRRDFKAMKSKIVKVLEESGQGQMCSYQHVDWSEHIEAKDAYRHSLEAIRHLYARCPRFVEDVRSATLPVIDNQEEAYEEAKEYLIKELAFVRVAHLILDDPQLLLVYHREWPLMNSFLEGKAYNLLAVQEHGFVVASPPKQAPNAL